MVREVEVSVLQCLDRMSLEGLQIHSSYLRDLVNSDAHNLALRYIHRVVIFSNDVTIQLEEEGDETHMSTQRERNFEALFHRVNNAFIHQLTLDFSRECLRLPYYLLANSTELQCKIRTLQVDALDSDIDYALVDFIGVHLKPQVYEAWVDVGTNEEYVMLFARNAVRGNVKHLEYECGGGPAPECVIPELFGADVVETCAMVILVDPRPWIRRFVEAFEMAERGAKVVRSVTLLHQDSPLSHAVDPLGHPRRTDAPTPDSAFIKERYDGTTFNESKAELFVIENAKASKKLEVYVWTVGDGDDDVQTAFLLQVVDM